MDAVERYTRARGLAQAILILAAELSNLDDQAYEYNLYFGADQAIERYDRLIEDAKEEDESGD